MMQPDWRGTSMEPQGLGMVPIVIETSACAPAVMSTG